MELAWEEWERKSDDSVLLTAREELQQYAADMPEPMQTRNTDDAVEQMTEQSNPPAESSRES